MTHDLCTVGEAMLRLWVTPGSRLERATRYRVAVAGAEANVAVALARMGRSTTWISRLPESALGRRVARELAGQGVDVGGVRWVDGARMGTYFVELSSPPRPSRVIYDRAGSAAAGLSVVDIPWDLVESAAVVHLTGITPALSPSCREATLEVARRARAGSVPITVDVNYRSALWSPEDARATLVELCSLATLVIVAERDAGTVFGLHGDPHRVAREARELLGVGSVILTRGSEGCVWRIGEAEGETPAFAARTVDRLGVGDAFAAGVILGLLEGDVGRGVRYGTAMGALKLGIEGDHFLADPDEVRALMGGEEGGLRR
jgi:2-dehydro-3-deoxygluconokinase